jgi:hypothetical protein
MKMFHRFLAILLLVAYASTGTSMFSLAMWSLAVIDGSHAIQVCETEHGTCIRLHHSEADFTPNVADHPSPSGQLVVSLCSEIRSRRSHLLSGALDDWQTCEEERDGSNDACPSEENVVTLSQKICLRPNPSLHKVGSRFVLTDRVANYNLRTLPTVRMLI